MEIRGLHPFFDGCKEVKSFCRRTGNKVSPVSLFLFSWPLLIFPSVALHITIQVSRVCFRVCAQMMRAILRDEIYRAIEDALDSGLGKLPGSAARRRVSLQFVNEANQDQICVDIGEARSTIMFLSASLALCTGLPSVSPAVPCVA